VKLYVGQARLSGSVRRYAERFDMVELRAESARLPRREKLRAWRAEAGDDLVFALVLGQAAYEPSGVDAALEYARGIAEVLSPAWWVLRTPASLTPAASAVRRLSDLVHRLPPGPRIAWEPSGPWDDAGALAKARQLGVHLVRDGSRDVLPPDDVVYTRLRALGEGANPSISAAEHLADELHGRDEAYVVIEGSGAGRVRAILQAELDLDAEDDSEGLDADDALDDEDDEDAPDSSRDDP
jgi:uncharacterized protein YecE (DUF72 family)